MDSKPLWVELFLNDEDLFKLVKMNMKIIERSIPELEHCIDLEKRGMKTEEEIKLTRSSISLTIETIAIQKRLLQRLERSKFLSASIIEAYRTRVQKIQDKAKEITIRENLK